MGALSVPGDDGPSAAASLLRENFIEQRSLVNGDYSAYNTSSFSNSSSSSSSSSSESLVIREPAPELTRLERAQQACTTAAENFSPTAATAVSHTCSSSSSSNRSTAGAVSSAFSTDHNLDQTLLLSSTAVPTAIVSGSVENGVGSSIIVSTSSSAPQIILQATHTTASLGSSGQTSPFSPTSFLQASGAAPVSYDVFSPFSFNSPKQATSYVSAQSVGGTAQGVSSSQPGSPEEASFASSQNNDSYYRTSTSSPTAAWSLTNPKTQTTQDNPFGILPHESVTAVASPPQATKQQQQQPTNSSGNYSVYSPQNGSATEAAKTPSAWSSSKQQQQQQSRTTSESPIDDNASFYNHHNGGGGASAYSPADGTHQSCIVTTPNVLSSSSPVPTTIYLTAATTTTQNQQTVVANSHDESSQSSPVSYSIMSYASPTQASQASNNGKTSGNGATVQFHVLGQAQQQRLYATTDQEYHHPVRSKSAASTDSAYSSSTSQNGPDCGAPGVVPRRPSPMQSSSSHSQASPLGHVPSPATYPMYNSPMTSMSSPSPLQQQQQQANVVQMTPPSPMIDAVTRSPSQQQNQVVYSSVITRALGTQNDSGGGSKAYNTADGSNYERTQDYVQTTKQLCPWDGDIQQQQTTTAYLTGSDQSDTRVLTTQQMHGLLDDHHHQQHQQHHHHLETTTINLQDLSTDDDPRELNGRRCAKIAPKRALPMTTGLESELANSVSYQLEALTASGQVVLNAQTSQQNGGYIELERWNLTPLQNGAKIIAAAPAAAASTAYVTTQQQHQQQQQQSAAAAAAAQVVQAASLVTANPTLLVAHPPTISYYPTFHIAQATPHITTHLQPQQQQQQQPQPQTTTVVTSDLQHTIEISTLDLQNDCQQHLPQQQQQLITIQQQDINSYNPDNVVREERPQVIVPDIEEELGFLKQVNNTTTTTTQRHSQHQQQNHHQHNHHNNGHYHSQQSRHSNNQQLHQQHQQQHNSHHHNNHHGVVTNNEPNSGFMTSFLKFLQGEKDSSPPPLARGGRKTGSWPKAVNKPYSNSASNSTDAWSNNRNNSTTTNDTKDKPAIDYANDPRYFPLPKERKRFDSSDDGFSSSENELGGSNSASFGRSKAGKSKENSRQNGGGDDSAAAAASLPYGLGPALPIKPPEGRPKKGRPIKPGGPTDRKRKAAAAAAAAAAEAAAKGLPYPPIPESKKKNVDGGGRRGRELLLPDRPRRPGRRLRLRVARHRQLGKAAQHAREGQLGDGRGAARLSAAAVSLDQRLEGPSPRSPWHLQEGGDRLASIRGGDGQERRSEQNRALRLVRGSHRLQGQARLGRPGQARVDQDHGPPPRRPTQVLRPHNRRSVRDLSPVRRQLSRRVGLHAFSRGLRVRLRLRCEEVPRARPGPQLRVARDRRLAAPPSAEASARQVGRRAAAPTRRQSESGQQAGRDSAAHDQPPRVRRRPGEEILRDGRQRQAPRRSKSRGRPSGRAGPYAAAAGRGEFSARRGGRPAGSRRRSRRLRVPRRARLRRVVQVAPQPTDREAADARVGRSGGGRAPRAARLRARPPGRPHRHATVRQASSVQAAGESTGALVRRRVLRPGGQEDHGHTEPVALRSDRVASSEGVQAAHPQGLLRFYLSAGLRLSVGLELSRLRRASERDDGPEFPSRLGAGLVSGADGLSAADSLLREDRRAARQSGSVARLLGGHGTELSCDGGRVSFVVNIAAANAVDNGKILKNDTKLRYICVDIACIMSLRARGAQQQHNETAAAAAAAAQRREIATSREQKRDGEIL
ncbi:unnamed protein product [Trichogramma brassicae]|uniref:Uncharacterized protein n=1 Tax=Trichogramma brassicae TaxID=86971 RepID=A0A6H5IY54_9HYME|nr:unnamed protein product [Trichogramma brassicae]